MSAYTDSWAELRGEIFTVALLLADVFNVTLG
jgi:hypothetical protein